MGFDSEDFLTEYRKICVKCNKIFILWKDFENHVMTHRVEKEDGECTENDDQEEEEKDCKAHICEICSLAFTNLKTFTAHANKHKGEKTYQCHICDESFLWQVDIIQHLMHIHANPNRKQCDHCMKRFSSKINFEEHMNTHSYKRPHKCFQCDIAFAWKFDLECHKHSHSANNTQKAKVEGKIKREEGRKYQCKLCNESIDRQMDMTEHLKKSQATGKQNQGNHCNECFSSKHHLDQHLVSHSFVRHYRCTKCEQAFVTKADFDNHVHKHAVCHVCYMVFDSEGDLIQHNVQLHGHNAQAPQAKPFICHLCYVVFDCETDSLKHNLKHTVYHSWQLVFRNPADFMWKGLPTALHKTEVFLEIFDL